MPHRLNMTMTGEPLPTHCGVDVQEGAQTHIWAVPEEVPIAFVYNGRNHAIMMATPADLADYAVGFSVTEQVIKGPGDILSLHIDQRDIGVDMRIEISASCLERFDLQQHRRNLVGRASCGICGLDNADRFFTALGPVADDMMDLSAAVLASGAHAFAQHQSLNRLTKTVHGAAWVNLGGEIVMVREDVGRHNALDKLLGAMLLNDPAWQDGFVLISSRCSYEMVEKAARCGVRALATLSGPTRFAVEKAREANITLYCQSADGFVRVCSDA